MKERNPAYLESERASGRKYYAKNKAVVQVYQHQYRREHKEDTRGRNAAYYESHREEIRAYRSERYRNGHRRIHPPKVRAAHVAVYNALISGRLERQPCQECGREKVHAHHDDYDKPLDVLWLCPRHHTARHQALAIQRLGEKE